MPSDVPPNDMPKSEVIMWHTNAVRNLELEDISALTVVKICILMIQVIDCRHAADVRNANLLKHERNCRG